MIQLSSTAWLWIGLTSIAFGGVLSSLFHSMKEMSRARLVEIAAIRNSAGAIRRIDEIIAKPDEHASAAALLRIVLNLISVVAIVFYVTSLRHLTAPSAQPVAIAPDVLDAVLGIGATTVLVWVIGFLVPQSISRHAAEVTVYVCSPIIRLLHILFKPVRGLEALIDEIIRRLAGRSHEDQASDMQQELMSVVQEAQEDGQFDHREKEMIQAVVKFRDLNARQVMTPRTEIEAMEFTNSLSEVTAYIRECAHSRIPVYRESIDSIAGIFYVKDLMRWLAGEGSRGGKTFELASILRPAIFIPETKTVRQTLEEMLAKKVHIAVVADEFGGTAGIITIEDIMEEIVGDIQDEYETQKEDKLEVKVDVSARTATIDAREYIDPVNDSIRVLGAQIPVNEDYETVAGFISVTLGHIPKVGQELRSGNMKFTVLEAEPMRVLKVRLEVVQQSNQIEDPSEPVRSAAGK